MVNTIRRRFSTKRVGHAGTLDPLATGLLVIAVGPATRFLQYLPLEPKEYVARISFGRATTTYDAEGETTHAGAVPTDLSATLIEELPKFRGLIQQLPPMYSAVKVAGKALYRYAREGQELKREFRTVHISEFEIQSVDQNVAIARIVCSGGTYIRSLAHDLGETIGCGAYLSGLERTKVGRFNLSEAVELEHASPQNLISLNEALPPMQLLALTLEQTQQVREGKQIDMITDGQSHLVALKEPTGQVFSIARVIGDRLQPECVIPEGVLNAST